MAGLLGTRASFASDVTLMLEIVILIFLAAGYVLMRRKALKGHGALMAGAVALHTLLILLVMVPSAAINAGAFASISLGVVITVIHIVTGTLADAFGILFVAKWRFGSVNVCYRRVKYMRPALWLWLSSLVLGLAFYAYYYV